MAEQQEQQKRQYKPRKQTPAYQDMGKLPPQASDMEVQVLGSLLIDVYALDTVVEILKEDAFYHDHHKKIYKAIMELYQENQPVDMLTVAEQLKKSGELEEIGGPHYIATLTNRVASSANVEYHARVVAEKYIKRELINISSSIITNSFEDSSDVFELLDMAEANLFAIAENNMKNSGKTVSNVLIEELKEIQARMEQDEALTGVGSGFTDLDKLTGGWQRSDLVILAARPGMGKTAFTLALARNAAIDLKKPVAFFSLEMSAGQLVQRLISMETEINGHKLRKGELEGHEWQQLTARIDKLREAQIVIDDSAGINILEMRAKLRRFKAKYDIQLVVIDYLQLMSGSSSSGKGGGNREQEISQISRSLKGIAKELNVPIIALSQLSRAVETRGGMKRPMLSDLRESGAIEQDADMVIFLYRPEYYGFKEDEDGNNVEGLGEVIVAKNRHGALETVKVRFIANYAKFADIGVDASQYNLNDLNGFNAAANTITIKSSMNDVGGPPPPAMDDDDVPF